LNPKAFGLIFDLQDAEDPELEDNGVAVVTIRGPLMNHRDFWFDSYDAIKERVGAALELAPKMIVLSIDSPGGLVSGAFDTARELRAMAAAAGVDLYAHVEGQGTREAYALASSAMWIGVSESAMIGSVGVVDMLVDQTAQNAALGLAVEVVTSGARKADGNPNVPISEGALEASQTRVDKLAEMFFELVAAHGWGGGVDELRALEAGIFTGAEAVELGLATEIATLDQTIAFASPAELREGTGATATDEKGRYQMAKSEDEAVAALRKMAESDDEDEARKARAALRALIGEEDDDGDDAKSEDDEDKDPPEAQDDDDDDAKAQDDDDDAKAEEDDDDAKAAASGGVAAMAAQALAEVHELKAERRKEKRTRERKRLLASRPDFAPELRAVLANPKTPIATVREMCSTLQRGASRAEGVAAAATATGTRGADQGDDRAARLPPAEKRELDLAMGLTETKAQTVHDGNRMSFGVRVPIAQKGK
jgi:ClpP class serine protease